METVIGMDRGTVELVALARAGDDHAFRVLVEPELRPSLRAATVVLGSEADAADAVQDALVIAWRKLGSLREPAAFSAWLRRIVTRETLRRATGRPKVAELAVAERIEGGDVERAFARRQLARAFRTLDGPDRTLLTLRYLLGLSVAEVGETLEIADGTVKSRTHQAIVRLRAAYEAEDRR